MHYQLKQLYCRPWLLSGLSLKLLESHYENNYGGALRRLNAITEQLESLDFATTPGHVIKGLKHQELVALNSMLLHELYFASLGGEGKPTSAMAEALARDFGSVQRWRTEFSAMGYALAEGSGWVLLTWLPRGGRLINQYSSEHGDAIPGGARALLRFQYPRFRSADFGLARGRKLERVPRIPCWEESRTPFSARSTAATSAPTPLRCRGNSSGFRAHPTRRISTPSDSWPGRRSPFVCSRHS